MAAEYIKGLQSERVAATIKHYVGNEQDTKRFSLNNVMSERAQRYAPSYQVRTKIDIIKGDLLAPFRDCCQTFAALVFDDQLSQYQRRECGLQ